MFYILEKNKYSCFHWFFSSIQSFALIWAVLISILLKNCTFKVFLELHWQIKIETLDDLFLARILDRTSEIFSYNFVFPDSLGIREKIFESHSLDINSRASKFFNDQLFFIKKLVRQLKNSRYRKSLCTTFQEHEKCKDWGMALESSPWHKKIAGKSFTGRAELS